MAYPVFELDADEDDCLFVRRIKDVKLDYEALLSDLVFGPCYQCALSGGDSDYYCNIEGGYYEQKCIGCESTVHSDHVAILNYGGEEKESMVICNRVECFDDYGLKLQTAERERTRMFEIQDEKLTLVEGRELKTLSLADFTPCTNYACEHYECSLCSTELYDYLHFAVKGKEGVVCNSYKCIARLE